MPRPRRLLCYIALSAWLACMHLPQCASAPSGGYETNRTSLDFNVSSASTGCTGDQCQLKIDLTYPTPNRNLPANAPVVVVISGFQAQASYYHYLATALAADSYVVVQYQTVATLGDVIWSCLHHDWSSCGLGSITDALELKFLAPVLQYSEEYAHKKLGLSFADFSTIALVGHSRGGKLAALHYASGDGRFKAALLLDPVDTTTWSPEGPDYPSALTALAAHPRPLAIAGAGIGWNLEPSCNPPTSNSTQFARVAAGGSSYDVVLPQTGHMQFIETNVFVEKGFNLLCEFGWLRSTAPNKVARQVAVELAVAWMDHQLRDGPPPDAPGSALCARVQNLGPSMARLQKKRVDGSWQETCGSSIHLAPT